MRLLRPNEINEIENYLQKGGLSLDPLKTEFIDHLICDIEIHMENGSDFLNAWQIVKNKIPYDHLTHIEEETMDLLNKKSNYTRIFTFILTGLLAIASFWQLMHFPGTGMLFGIFFIFISLILLFGSVRNVYIHREKKGKVVLILAAISVIACIVSWLFSALGITSAYPLKVFSIFSISILFPALSIYFYQSKQNLKDHLLIRWINDNHRTLEYSIIIMVGFGLVINHRALLYAERIFLGEVFILITIILTGLYVYTLTWLHYINIEKPLNDKPNIRLLIASSVALVMFMLAVLGNVILDFGHRQILGSGSLIIFISIVIIHYIKYSDSEHKNILVILSGVFLFYFLLMLGIKLEWLQGELGSLTSNTAFNAGILLFLGVILIVYRKHKLLKLLTLLTIASHTIQIP